MLLIREVQMAAMRSANLRAREDALVLHLRNHFPQQFGSMPEAELLRYVRSGVEKARGYGLDSGRDVYRLLNLMAIFGADFDLEPDHAWMREELLDPAGGTPSRRLELLTDECIRRAQVSEVNTRRRRRFLEPG